MTKITTSIALTIILAVSSQLVIAQDNEIYAPGSVVPVRIMIKEIPELKSAIKHYKAELAPSERKIAIFNKRANKIIKEKGLSRFEAKFDTDVSRYTDMIKDEKFWTQISRRNLLSAINTLEEYEISLEMYEESKI